jgi:hypothetical protein
LQSSIGHSLVLSQGTSAIRVSLARSDRPLQSISIDGDRRIGVLVARSLASALEVEAIADFEVATGSRSELCPSCDREKGSN